ncbi:hypothetical protein CRYUN_Cryun25bG0012200 [Craigia yunnanensis]
MVEKPNTSKATQSQFGVSVDAAAAAAILQAATRGFKNPNLKILSKTSLNVSSQVPSGEGGYVPSFGSLPSSQVQSSIQKPGQKGEPSVSGPVTNAIAAASEADSYEACLTKEEKLKDERLKRAKMFAVTLKCGAAPLKTKPLRGLSAELPESGVSGSGVEGGSLIRKEREGSSVALDINTSDKNEKHEKIYSGIDHNERRSKRKYHSISKRHEEDSSQEEEEEEKGRDKHSGKKPRSITLHTIAGIGVSIEKGIPLQRIEILDIGISMIVALMMNERSRFRNDHNGSSGDEHQHSRHCHNYHSSSDDEYRHRRKRSHSGREVELEEGEICAKSDQSKLSEGNDASGEASVDISKPYADGRAPSLPSETTMVSVDLRAKIRAMLMATL